MANEEESPAFIAGGIAGFHYAQSLSRGEQIANDTQLRQIAARHAAYVQNAVKGYTEEEYNDHIAGFMAAYRVVRPLPGQFFKQLVVRIVASDRATLIQLLQVILDELKDDPVSMVSGRENGAWYSALIKNIVPEQEQKGKSDGKE